MVEDQFYRNSHELHTERPRQSTLTPQLPRRRLFLGAPGRLRTHYRADRHFTTPINCKLSDEHYGHLAERYVFAGWNHAERNSRAKQKQTLEGGVLGASRTFGAASSRMAGREPRLPGGTIGEQGEIRIH